MSVSMAAPREHVHSLIALARDAVQLGLDDSVTLLEGIDRYLAAFELWQASIVTVNPLGVDSKLTDSEKQEFREELLVLEHVHQELVGLAEQCRDRVRNDISEIRKRSHALKAYIDRYPSRITIAGKREG